MTKPLHSGDLVRWQGQSGIVTLAECRGTSREPIASSVDVLFMDGYTRTFVRGKSDDAVYQLRGSDRADDVLRRGLA